MVPLASALASMLMAPELARDAVALPVAAAPNWLTPVPMVAEAIAFAALAVAVAVTSSESSDVLVSVALASPPRRGYGALRHAFSMNAVASAFVAPTATATAPMPISPPLLMITEASPSDAKAVW